MAQQPAFAVVLDTRNIARAEILRVVLESEGIRAMIENEHQAGLTGVLRVKLRVPTEDAERARAIIAEHDTDHSDEEE